MLLVRLPTLFRSRLLERGGSRQLGAKVEPSDDGGSPEVVVVPELQPVGTPAGPESASDLLDRLVEPVPEHGSTEAPRYLRAKLARTAALKKPGSKERREADEQNRS